MKKLSILLLIPLCLFLLGISKANVNTDSFVVLIEDGGSLGFQNDVVNMVYLTVTNGSLNSSYAYVSIYSGGGYFVFRGNNTASFDVIPSENLAVITEINNTIVEWGDGISLTSSDTFLLRWSVRIAPFLPLIFIIGIFGFICLFAGMLYPIHLFKKGEWINAVIWGATLLSLGIAFVIAWLWGG